MTRYVEAIQAIAYFNHKLVDKFAHVIVGLLLWLVIAAAARRPLDSRLPLLGVAAIGLANELVEMTFEPTWSLLDAGGDMLANLFVPVLVSLALRLFPATRG